MSPFGVIDFNFSIYFAGLLCNAAAPAQAPLPESGKDGPVNGTQYSLSAVGRTDCRDQRDIAGAVKSLAWYVV